MQNNELISKRVRESFTEAVLKSEEFRGRLNLYIRRENISEVMTFLKNDPELLFDFLADLTAVDYLKTEKSPRFQVVYNLRSMKHGRRLTVKAPVPENDCRIESVVKLWNSANWLERETYEMYGITFDNHPDLRKLLMPEAFRDYPLRKDYPVRGKGEREALLPEGS